MLFRSGNVTAKSISVEKGGIFMGQLIIGTSGLAQGELLPETPAATGSTSTTEDAAPIAVPHPLPAA